MKKALYILWEKNDDGHAEYDKRRCISVLGDCDFSVSVKTLLPHANCVRDRLVKSYMRPKSIDRTCHLAAIAETTISAPYHPNQGPAIHLKLLVTLNSRWRAMLC